MDTGPHPHLLSSDVCNADIDRPGRLKHHVTVLEKVLKGGGGGGNTKDATGLLHRGRVGDARIGCTSTRRVFPEDRLDSGTEDSGDVGEEGGPGPPEL